MDYSSSPPSLTVGGGRVADWGNAAFFEGATVIFLFGGGGASVFFGFSAWVKGTTVTFIFFGTYRERYSSSGRACSSLHGAKGVEVPPDLEIYVLLSFGG